MKELCSVEGAIIFVCENLQNKTAPRFYPPGCQCHKMKNKTFDTHAGPYKAQLCCIAVLADSKQQISNHSSIQINGIHFHIIKRQLAPTKIIIQFFKMMLALAAPLIVIFHA